MRKKHWQLFFEADGAGGGTDTPPEGGGTEPATKTSIFDNPADEPAPVPTPEDKEVPESYEFKLGEGLSISDTLKERFTKVAKEASLTQAQVNAMMDMHSETMLEVLNAGEKQAAEWEAECKAQGLLTKEKLGYAVEALNVFGGDEAKRVLIETGAANHPAVMLMLQRIGELIHEDSNKEGETEPDKNKDLGAILFANSKYN